MVRQGQIECRVEIDREEVKPGYKKEYFPFVGGQLGNVGICKKSNKKCGLAPWDRNQKISPSLLRIQSRVAKTR